MAKNNYRNWGLPDMFGDAMEAVMDVPRVLMGAARRSNMYPMWEGSSGNLPIDDWSWRKRSDLMEEVRERRLGREDLIRLRNYEKNHRNRSSLVKELEEEIAASEASAASGNGGTTGSTKRGVKRRLPGFLGERAETYAALRAMALDELTALQKENPADMPDSVRNALAVVIGEKEKLKAKATELENMDEQIKQKRLELEKLTNEVVEKKSGTKKSEDKKNDGGT